MGHATTNKVDAQTLRASAALAASGAYDTPTAFGIDDGTSVELFVTYTRGAASGAAKLKVSVSPDASAYYPRTAIDEASFSAGVANVYVAEFKLPVSTGTDPETYTFQIPNLENALAIKVAFAEYGNTGTPGTLACTAVVGRSGRS